jgi:hypothetical protein
MQGKNKEIGSLENEVVIDYDIISTNRRFLKNTANTAINSAKLLTFMIDKRKTPV